MSGFGDILGPVIGTTFSPEIKKSEKRTHRKGTRLEGNFNYPGGTPSLRFTMFCLTLDSDSR